MGELTLRGDQRILHRAPLALTAEVRIRRRQELRLDPPTAWQFEAYKAVAILPVPLATQEREGDLVLHPVVQRPEDDRL